MKIEKLLKVVDRACTDLEGRIAGMKSAAKDQPPVISTSERLVARITHLADEGRRVSKAEQERILGSNDLVDLNFFERGQRAARAVCRVVLCDAAGRQIGVASGFMVSPRLMLTNYHVFPTQDEANGCLAEFDYALDIEGVERKGSIFTINPRNFYHANDALDFALVAIEPKARSGDKRLSDYGFLRLNPTVAKINEREFVSIVQHPSGLPKQVALRENQLLSIENDFLVYASDTAQGSSGSPLFNDSWQVIGLHSAGVPRKNAQGQWLTRSGQVAGRETDDADIDWIGNRGVRVSRIIEHVETLQANSYLTELLAAARGAPGSAPRPSPSSPLPSPSPNPDESSIATVEALTEVRIVSQPGGTLVQLPTGFALRIESNGVAPLRPAQPSPPAGADVSQTPALLSAEVYKEAIIDTPYSTRKGYKEDFLGVAVPLPTVTHPSVTAKMDNGEYVIPYQNFSIVMHARRRMALYTAANVDASPKAKKPEANRDYGRDALGGFGENDTEMWTHEPRIDASEQLPDRFYLKDRQAFDKGHIVRREDAAWGQTYAQVRRANGDTYHLTNCSPQVMAYNRSNKKGIWGMLENYVLKQAKNEKLCVFAGPIFDDSDREFTGEDADGSELKVQIPRRFWKLVVAESEGELEAFAFVLEQDLKKVAWEFSVDAKWEEYMKPISWLEDQIGLLKFKRVIHNADQYGKPAADELMALTRG